MDWSTEYRFEDLPFKVNGIYALTASGIAELAHCETDGFYVKAIILDGEEVEMVRMPLGNRKPVREDASLHLMRPFTNSGPQDFNQYIFEAIQSELEADDRIAEWFREQMQEAA